MSSSNGSAEQCKSCALYKAKPGGSSGGKIEGWCRRFPPIVMNSGIGFPPVSEDKWCGEWADNSS